MYCSVPTERLNEKRKKVEAKRGYQIRKSKELRIFKKASEVLRCGSAKSHGLYVYRSQAHGIGIQWFKDVVYHAYSENHVTECHLDYAWVDALDLLLAKVRQERRKNKVETAKQVNEIASIDRRFG
jgi:hypothetical protein